MVDVTNGTVVLINVTDGERNIWLTEMVLADDVGVSIVLNVELANILDIVEYCSLFDDAALVVTWVIRVISIPVTPLAPDCVGLTILLDTDGVEICSLLKMLLIVVTNDVMFGLLIDGTLDVAGAGVCSLLDGTLAEVTDDNGINVLLDVTLVNVNNGVNICSLLDAILIAITSTDVVEVGPLLAIIMAEVIDCTKVSILLDVMLALNVIDSGVDCSLLDVVVIELMGSVEDSTVGAVVEIREESSVLNTLLVIVVAGEMINDRIEVIGGATVEVSDNEKVWSLLDITPVGKIDNKEVNSLFNVLLSNTLAITVLVNLTVFVVSRLVYTTAVLLIDVNSVEACPLLDSALVGK